MSKKLKILTISDHPLSPSGVGTQSRYVCESLLKTGKYQIISLGGALIHGDNRPMKFHEYGDDWVLFPIQGYGNQDLIRSAIRTHKPDILWFMTDPRFFTWLWEIENEIRALLETKMVYAKPAVFQQEQGFISTLPLEEDKLSVHNSLNTGPLSSVFPFISSDLSDNKGVLYGINRHNNSLILFDRFSLENPNLLLFGVSGGGKSYFVKLEVLRSLMQDIEVIIIDPEKEYKYLAETVGGSFIDVSLNAPYHLNPFDLPIPRGDERPADLLRSNIINLVGLMRIMLGGLTPEEDAIMDKALTETYAARDITPDSDFKRAAPPVMHDLQTVLKSMTGGESLAIRLEKFVSGSYSGFFNQPTNIELNKKLVTFCIRDMEQELRPLAMYIVLHYIWNMIRSEIKKRLMVVDEAWVMMQSEEAANFLFSIAKRCRKYYLGLTTITQDIADFMESKYGKPIVSNSSLQILMKQSPATIDIIQQTFDLTEQEKYRLLESNVGEGIFFAGAKRAAIQVVASYGEDQIITSDPAQLIEIERAKQELARQEKQIENPAERGKGEKANG